MTALYWDDFDCDETSRRIEHPSTVHVHVRTHHEACVAFLNVLARWETEHAQGRRYWCVRGPGGIVRGVKEDHVDCCGDPARAIKSRHE